MTLAKSTLQSGGPLGRITGVVGSDNGIEERNYQTVVWT